MDILEDFDKDWNDSPNIFSERLFKYLFFLLIIMLLFFVFHNLFFIIPERMTMFSIDMEIPVIPADPGELKTYDSRIKAFENEQLLKSFNKEGIFTREQRRKGMVTPAE